MNVKKIEDTNMSIKLRKAYSSYICELSEPFYCGCFDHNCDNQISDMCGTATTFGFGYV